MSEALEATVNEYPVEGAFPSSQRMEAFPEGSPCAMGACPMPESTVEPEVEETLIAKGDLVIFNLRGKVRPGKVISKGSKFLGIDTIGLQSNTKIAADTKFVPLTVFVEKAVLDELETVKAA